MPHDETVTATGDICAKERNRVNSLECVGPDFIPPRHHLREFRPVSCIPACVRVKETERVRERETDKI